MGLVGLIGILSFLGGVALLWQARKEVFYWLQEFFRILRGEFSRHGGLTGEVQRAPAAASTGGAGMETPVPGSRASPGDAGPHRPRRSRGALLLLGGFTLMVLGQVLFILGLTF